MSLINTLAQLALQKFSGQTGTDQSGMASALSQLLPTSGGDLDLSALVSRFTSNGTLASLASSWLANGSNMQLQPSQLISAFGQDKISQFASQIGIGESAASEGLADIIPNFIDKNSEGGQVKSDLISNVASSVLGGFFK